MEFWNLFSIGPAGGIDVTFSEIIQRLRNHHHTAMRRDESAQVSLVPAAVLVPLIERSEGCTVLMTRRAEHLLHHPGQVSFPGGHMENADISPTETALRETEEEIGLSRDHIDVLGPLDDYVTTSGFLVHPIVGRVRPPFMLSLDEREVADAFEVPLSFILDHRNHRQRSQQFPDGRRRSFYEMPFGDHVIWGATAGILVNLWEILRETCVS